MLSSLTIQNLVLIDHLDLEIKPGMLVFTGETGAGKSMLLDAFDLLMGGKGDKSLLRDNSKNLSVSASFLMSPQLSLLLEETGIEAHDDDVMIRRVIDPSGKSKAFIQNTPVPLGALKSIAEIGVEVHGQMDRLLKPSEYRNFLDEYAHHADLLKECAQSYKLWKNALSDIENHQNLLRQAEENLERLRFERDELRQLSPKDHEETALDQERSELKSLASHHALMREVLRMLEGALQPALYDIQKNLARIDQLQEWDQKLDGYSTEISELESTIKSLLGGHQNPEKLTEIEERLSLIRHLARKHKCRGDDLVPVLERVEEEIAALEKSEETGKKLEDMATQARQAYKHAAHKLSKSREKAAQTLESDAQKELPDLKLEHALFKIAVHQVEDDGGTSLGVDKVEFLFQANPGSSIQPLNKVASGGELSRLMLALKVASSKGRHEEGNKTTIIFDEIDSGVGGAVAAAIGGKLKRLSKSQQTLCITHAPQVASCANYHYKVSKSTDGHSTRTEVRLLTEIEREIEIARMLSGEDITPAAREAAKSLIASS